MKSFSRKLFFSFFIFLFAFLISCGGKLRVTPQQQPELSRHLDSLVEAGNFFIARDLYKNQQEKLDRFQQLKIGLFLDNVFNQPHSSLRKYTELKKNYESKINDSLHYKLVTIAGDNYLKLYEYQKLVEIQEEILNDYEGFIAPEEKENLQNTLIIWRALQNVPKQEVMIPGEVSLQLHRDKLGLKNLEVTAGDISQNFIFDTGANFSTITESTAEQFNLTMLNGHFEVNSITGKKVLSQIAVAPEIRLGEIRIKNAVFLVFPDAALAFPQLDFQINGILGFPVIEALNEIQLTATDEFIVPLKQTEFHERNLAIDFLTPLLYIKDRYAAGSYTFDTGASHTMLYNTYYHRLSKTVTDTLPEVDYSFGGAGGGITKKGIYHSFSPEIHGKRVNIDSVIVLKEPVTEKNQNFGNLGQDLIGKFEKMTINFEKMFVRFE